VPPFSSESFILCASTNTGINIHTVTILPMFCMGVQLGVSHQRKTYIKHVQNQGRDKRLDKQEQLHY
jgi:hypothetical protein